ncbi:MAG: metallophosphoesterase [Kiritimatiellae bacterium]|jgi:3',5'-cyclic AMP phosphodiesterase CpdA|nr:metallophosphoesterase [Kiritimatiellia bacterium]
MKFIHISDLHLYTKGYTFVDLLYPKRFVGWLNYIFRRKCKFVDSIDKLNMIEEFVVANNVDGVVFSGDLTCLGSRGEFERAKAFIERLFKRVKYTALIPGNHDYYINKSIYNSVFGDMTNSDNFIKNDLCDVVKFSDNVYVIILNSVKPNPITPVSSGKVSTSQIDSLKKLIDELLKGDNKVFVCSHYGLRKPDGSIDSYTHGIVNQKELEDVVSDRDMFFLHGHIHYTYKYELGKLKCYGAGGTTFLDREAFWLFECYDEVEASIVKYMDGEYVCG